MSLYSKAKLKMSSWYKKLISEPDDETRVNVGPNSTNANVGSRISSCQPKIVTCVDKHWSEMSTDEKIKAGPFLCFVKPDEYDKRQGKFVEFMILYDDYDEYVNLKNFAIETGRLEQLVQQ